MAIARRSVRRKRVAKGVAAAPKKFKGTRSAVIAKKSVKKDKGKTLSQARAEVKAAKKRLDTLRDRLQQERMLGVGRGKRRQKK